MKSDLDEQSPLIQNEETDKKESFAKRNKKWIIIAVVILVIIIILLLTMFVFIPLIMASILQNYLDASTFEVLDFVLISQNGTRCYCNLTAIFSYESSLNVHAVIDPVILDLYVENPNNREELIFGATMLLPSIATTGSETLVEISTYIDLYNNDAFHMFLEDLFGYESVNVYGRGELLITTDFPGYKNRKLSGKLEDKALSIKGFHGMNFSITELYLVSSSENELLMNWNTTLYNPSTVWTAFPLSVYNQNCSVYYQGVKIGDSWPDNLVITRGYFNALITGTIHKTPENEELLGTLLSNYLFGRSMDMKLEGTARLDLGFGKPTDGYPTFLSIPGKLIAVEEKVIEELAIPIIGINPIPPIKVPAQAKVFNPMQFDASIAGISLEAWAGQPCNRTISTVNEDWSENPIHLPKRDFSCLEGLEFNIKLADLDCVLEGLRDHMPFYANNGLMHLLIGEFSTLVPFEDGPLVSNMGRCQTKIDEEE